MHTVQDAAQIGTRTYTSAGFLRAGITVTRPGIVEYDGADIGLGKRGQRIRVRRTSESVFHPETLRSIRAATVTLGHPKDGDVTPESYRELSVGAIAGEPVRTTDGMVGADVLIAEPEAIRRVQTGTDEEASIRYRATFVPSKDSDADYETSGPLDINHIALVSSGRAGPTVRVQDSDGDDMTKDEISAAIRSAVADIASSDCAKSGGPDIRAVVSDALKPLITRIEKVSEAQDASDAKARKEEAKQRAEKAANELEARVRGEERARYAVLQDAMRFIPQDKRGALADAATKEILVAALGDSIPDANKQSEEFLRGALRMRAQDRERVESRPTIGRAADAQQSVSDAHAEYVRSLTDGYKSDRKE